MRNKIVTCLSWIITIALLFSLNMGFFLFIGWLIDLTGMIEVNYFVPGGIGLFFFLFAMLRLVAYKIAKDEFHKTIDKFNQDDKEFWHGKE